MDTDPTAIAVRHAPDAHRYELVDGDRIVGEAQYLPFEGPEGSQRVFFHTVVDDAYGGRGLAGRLATHALEDTVAAGLTVVAVCPYIRAFLPRHPELARHAVPVERAHLAAVRRRAGVESPSDGEEVADGSPV